MEKQSVCQPISKIRLLILSISAYAYSAIIQALLSKAIGNYLLDVQTSFFISVLVSIIVSSPTVFKAVIVSTFDFLEIPVLPKLGRSKSLMIYLSVFVGCMMLLISFVDAATTHVVQIFGTHLTVYTGKFILTTLCFIGTMAAVCMDAVNSGYFNSITHKNNRIWINGGSIGYNICTSVALGHIVQSSQYIPWNIIFRYAIYSNLLILPLLIFGPKCNRVKYQTKHNLLSSYKEPANDLYQRHKKYAWPLLIFIIFFRSPDKILSNILSLVKQEILGKELYGMSNKYLMPLVIVVGSLISTYISDNHYKRLRNINIVHSTGLLSLGLLVYLHQTGLYTWTLTALLIIFMLLKFIRIIESGICFSYQCDLASDKFFQSQLTMISAVEFATGKLLAVPIAAIISLMGAPLGIAIATCCTIPAATQFRRLKRDQEIMTITTEYMSK